MKFFIVLLVLVAAFLISWGVYLLIKFHNFKCKLMNAFRRAGVNNTEANQIYLLYRNEINRLHLDGTSPEEIVLTIVSLFEEVDSCNKLSKQQIIKIANELYICVSEFIGSHRKYSQLIMYIENRYKDYKIEDGGKSIYWLESDFPEWLFLAKENEEEYDLYVNINNSASVKKLFGFSLSVNSENNSDSSSTLFDKIWIINLHDSIGGCKATQEAKLLGRELETVINNQGGNVIFDDKTQI